MAWRAITEADLVTKISGAELEGYRGAALAASQPDPVQPAIDQVVAEVRGYIAANAANSLDPDTATIPERLIGAAISRIIIQIMSRAGGSVMDPNDVRRKAAADALELLKNVASAQFAIDPPDGGDGRMNASSRINKKRRHFRRDQEDGI